MGDLVDRFLILGLGNPILSDDQIGLNILQQAKTMFQTQFPTTCFKESCDCGIDLISELENFTKVLVIDSIQTNEIEPGQIVEYDLQDFSSVVPHNFVNPHSLNLPTIVSLGKQLGYHMPNQVKLIGIEGRDFTTISQSMSEEVQGAISPAIKLIQKYLTNWSSLN